MPELLKRRQSDCLTCEGTGWMRRQVPHPGFVEYHPVTVTKTCPECNGSGEAKQPQLFETEVRSA